MASDASSAGGPPVTVQLFAEISARVAEGVEPLPALLSGYGLDVASWHDISAHFTRLLALEPEPGAHGVAYAEAFARAQDALRPIPPMTVEQWAQVVEDFGVRGGAALEERGISGNDHLRLSRHWARTMANERATANAYHRAFFAAARRRKEARAR